MKWTDILLLVMILGYCAYVIFAKKGHGCSGNCNNCSGCACKEKK